MTTISKDTELVTFINIFTVEPANQKRLVNLLSIIVVCRVPEKFMSHDARHRKTCAERVKIETRRTNTNGTKL